MVSINELTLTDAEFLQTVNEINKHPEKHKHTDKGKVPANSKSIRLSSSLNSNQVSYRMGGNSNSRGFAKSDNPLIISHEPVKIDSGFGPRSVELTDKGVEVLEKSQEQVNEISGISRSEFEELKEKIEKVEGSLIATEERARRTETDKKEIVKFLKKASGYSPSDDIISDIDPAVLRAKLFWELHDRAEELGRPE